jgi:hypothetical protein
MSTPDPAAAIREIPGCYLLAALDRHPPTGEEFAIVRELRRRRLEQARARGGVAVRAKIHAAPGRDVWQRRSALDKSPRDLLHELDTAPSAWRRSEALLRLLTGPQSGEVGGMELDLHREAAARIGLVLRNEERRPDPERGLQANDWLRFEVLALRHGALLAQRAVPDDARRRVHAAWLLGDWIGRVLRESPFLGADPELLAARLEAVLPAQPAENPDALWPARLGTGAGSLRLDEVWLLHTLFLAREQGWEPPGAVLDGLRALADRPVNEAERDAEVAFEEELDELHWPGAHLAPPLAARWLLHAWRAAWLAKLRLGAQDETIGWLERWIERGRAVRGIWVMLALYREGSGLGAAGERARALWMRVLTAEGDPAERLGDALGPFCLWGSTYLATLASERAEILAQLAQHTAVPWRVGVLLTLAEALQSARDALVALVGSPRERELRLPAAVASLQLARKLPDSERESLVQHVVDRLGPDLRAHPNVRVELKRVGRAA